MQEKEQEIIRLTEKVEALEQQLSREEKKRLNVRRQPRQQSARMKLTWRKGQPAPESMTLRQGTTVVHGSTAYFSRGNCLYSYTENKWTKLPECQYEYFAMAVIDGKLTTIGGDYQGMISNTLSSLCGSSWKEVLPPMPTNRVLPAAADTPTHLVVAGGRQSLVGRYLTAAEVLNMETRQWSTVSSLPRPVDFPQMTICGGRIYLNDDEGFVFSCSLEDLFKSTNSKDGGSVWTRLANIQAKSSLATLRDHVLAIEGKDGADNPTGAISCYDVDTNSWNVTSEMPTPRSLALAAVLPGNELVVVGGRLLPITDTYCNITDIGRASPRRKKN